MRRSRWIFSSILIVVLTAAVIVAMGRSLDRAASLSPTPIAQANQPAAPSSVEGIYILPDDGPGPLIAELDAARESIWIEVYLLTNEDVLSALFRAKDRGVDVRVLLEKDPFGGSNTQDEVFTTLGEGGIEVRWDESERRFSHVKMIVVDRRVALVMNLNLTYSGLNRNRELAVITTDPAKVEHAVRIFENDWNGDLGSIPGALIISPDTSRQAILGLVDQARTSLDIYAEVIADAEFIEAVRAALDRGVQVRIVMTQSYGQDLMAEPVGELVRSGALLHAVSDPYIHAKLLLADGQTALIGSQNFTATSLDQNREVGTTASVPSNIERLQRVFDRDFAIGAPIMAAALLAA